MAYPYIDPYYGSIIATYGGQAVVWFLQGTKLHQLLVLYPSNHIEDSFCSSF